MRCWIVPEAAFQMTNRIRKNGITAGNHQLVYRPRAQDSCWTTSFKIHWYPRWAFYDSEYLHHDSMDPSDTRTVHRRPVRSGPSTEPWLKNRHKMNVENFLLKFTNWQEIYFCSGHQCIFIAFSALFEFAMYIFRSCDLRTITFDLSIFYDKSWNFIYIDILMFFFDMFSGDIFTVEALFANCTLKSCEIQMSVIMTLQIFFIPKILWRGIWFDYWK